MIFLCTENYDSDYLNPLPTLVTHLNCQIPLLKFSACILAHTTFVFSFLSQSFKHIKSDTLSSIPLYWKYNVRNFLTDAGNDLFPFLFLLIPVPFNILQFSSVEIWDATLFPISSNLDKGFFFFSALRCSCLPGVLVICVCLNPFSLRDLIHGFHL